MTRGAHCYPEQTPFGLPKRTRGALPYPDSLREKHTGTSEHHIWTIAYLIRICRPDHKLKWASLATSFRQSAIAHVNRLQSERTGMMASRLPRSLTAVYRVMMTLPSPRGIMTSQKVFPPLKREAELLTLYKRIFTQGGR